MDQFLAIDDQIREIQDNLSKIDKDILTLTKKTQRVKLKTNQVLEYRKALTAELYMISDDKLFFINYFVSADRFFNLLKGKDETQILAEEQIARISKINTLLGLLAKQQNLYQDKIKNSLVQKSELVGRMNLVLNNIKKQQTGLEKVDLRAAGLEQYLLSLGKIDCLNERDFLSWNSASGENFQFTGGGTEHGLGMSQHGAKGMAKLGKNYSEILSHYYQKTKLAKIPNPDVKIRVGIVLGGGGGRIEVLDGSASVAGKNISSKEILENGSLIIGLKKIKIFKSNNQKPVIFSNPGNVIIRPTAGQTKFQISYKLSGFNLYQGRIQVKNIGGSLYTINSLKLENYLKGVLPGEMPHSWPMEALKAQAVAARSYAYRQLHPSKIFDVDDTTRYQVYLGASYQFESTNQAISETAGKVLRYGAEVIPAYYHSTSGGYTENNENVWGGRPRAYLRAVASPWEEESPWWTWYSKIFSRAELSTILASNPKTSVGTLKTIQILQRGVSGRVLVVKLRGSKRSVLVTGQTLRRVINYNLPPTDPPLRSILFGVKK